MLRAPPPVKTIISMNYTIGNFPFPVSPYPLGNGEFMLKDIGDEGFIDDTANAAGILLSVNDNNGNPIIPSLSFLNNNTLKFTLIQGNLSSSTIIPPNSFVFNAQQWYETLTSVDLTFMPNQIFTNGPITIQIETL